MTIYQISITDQNGVHVGYNYVGSYPEAKMEIHRLGKVWHDERVEIDYSAYDVTPSKNGILKLLNAVAGHPNNG